MPPRIALMAAVAENGVIGKDQRLPWHLPADLAHFKRTTLGKPVVMGRKTFESIGKPLPGRKNIVLTRDPDFRAEGATIVRSIDDAVRAAEHAEELVVIGGASIYEQFLPRASRLYLTEVHAKFEGDTRFQEPAGGWLANGWTLAHREDHPPDDRNAHAYSFVTWERA